MSNSKGHTTLNRPQQQKDTDKGNNVVDASLTDKDIDRIFASVNKDPWSCTMVERWDPLIKKFIENVNDKLHLENIGDILREEAVRGKIFGIVRNISYISYVI